MIEDVDVVFDFNLVNWEECTIIYLDGKMTFLDVLESSAFYFPLLSNLC